MSRSAGSTSLTTRPPMSISPPEMVSSPATMRSSVDLPQPEGPTSTQNWPSPTSKSMPLMASKPPGYVLRTLRSVTLAIVLTCEWRIVNGEWEESPVRYSPFAIRPLHSPFAIRPFHTHHSPLSLFRLDQAAHEQPLHEDDHRDRRQHGEHRGRHRKLPFGELVLRHQHLLDADHDGLHRILCGDQ